MAIEDDIKQALLKNSDSSTEDRIAVQAFIRRYESYAWNPWGRKDADRLLPFSQNKNLVEILLKTVPEIKIQKDDYWRSLIGYWCMMICLIQTGNNQAIALVTQLAEQWIASANSEFLSILVSYVKAYPEMPSWTPLLNKLRGYFSSDRIAAASSMAWANHLGIVCPPEPWELEFTLTNHPTALAPLARDREVYELSFKFLFPPTSLGSGDPEYSWTIDFTRTDSGSGIIGGFILENQKKGPMLIKDDIAVPVVVPSSVAHLSDFSRTIAELFDLHFRLEPLASLRSVNLPETKSQLEKRIITWLKNGKGRWFRVAAPTTDSETSPSDGNSQKKGLTPTESGPSKIDLSSVSRIRPGVHIRELKAVFGRALTLPRKKNVTLKFDGALTNVILIEVNSDGFVYRVEFLKQFQAPEGIENLRMGMSLDEALKIHPDLKTYARRNSVVEVFRFVSENMKMIVKFSEDQLCLLTFEAKPPPLKLQRWVQ